MSQFCSDITFKCVYVLVQGSKERAFLCSQHMQGIEREHVIYVFNADRITHVTHSVLIECDLIIPSSFQSLLASTVMNTSANRKFYSFHNRLRVIMVKL